MVFNLFLFLWIFFLTFSRGSLPFVFFFWCFFIFSLAKRPCGDYLLLVPVFWANPWFLIARKALQEGFEAPHKLGVAFQKPRKNNLNNPPKAF